MYLNPNLTKILLFSMLLNVSKPLFCQSIPSQLKEHTPRDLVSVFESTQKDCHRGYYEIPGQGRVHFDPAATQEMKSRTELYSTCPNFHPERGVYFFKTDYRVVNQDSLFAAQELIKDGKHPLVLNFANRYVPGGGVIKGAPAQEETLMRCSAYYQALNPDENPILAAQLQKEGLSRYLIPETGAIFTPRVTVFRDTEYNYLAEPFEVDMLASAAYNQKEGHWGGAKDAYCSGDPFPATLDLQTGTREKIRTQLTIAAMKGKEHLVLGAFGCGAFNNPPEMIAQIYRDLLEGEFNGIFQTVTFAVLASPGSKSGQRNLQVFSDAFE